MKERKERLLRLDLEIILDVILDEYVNEMDYALRKRDNEIWVRSIKDYFISFLECYLDKYRIVAIENVPFAERFIVRNENDIKRLFIDNENEFVDWRWLEELAIRHLRELGHSKKKVKKFLNSVY
jgi:hypothetical protein